MTKRVAILSVLAASVLSSFAATTPDMRQQRITSHGFRLGETAVRTDAAALKERLSPSGGWVYATPRVETDNRNTFTNSPALGEKVLRWWDYAGYERVNTLEGVVTNYLDGVVHQGDTTVFTVPFDEKRFKTTQDAGDHLIVVDLDYIRYHLSYNQNGGNFKNVPSRREYVYTNAFALAETGATRDGYDFGGWTNAAGKAFVDGASVTGASFDITNRNDNAEVVLHAKWIPRVNTLAYELNEGEWTADARHPETATYDVAFAVDAPRKTGYSFTGWVVTNGVDSTARWGEDESRVTSVINPNTTCIGWFPDKEVWFKNLSRAATNVVLTAGWTGNVYRVVFQNGGADSGEKERFFTYGSEVSINAPVFAGHSFMGYYTGENGTGDLVWDENCHLVGSKVWSVPSELTVYAKWAAKTYTIHYDSNGGEGSVPDQDFEFGTSSLTLSKGDEFSKGDLTLVGWGVSDRQSSASFTNGWTGSSTDFFLKADSSLQAVTLYAVWYDSRRNVTFVPGTHGTLSESERQRAVKVGEPYGTLPVPKPVDTRYAFTGWYTARLEGSAVTPETPVPDGEKEYSVWAHWTPTSYFVAFDGNGATNAPTETVQEMRFDTPTNLLANAFVRIGHQFGGWATSREEAELQQGAYADGARVENLASVANETNTLYAIWTTNRYTVVYDANGGKGEMASSVHDYDTTWQLPYCTFVKLPTGSAEFAGWGLSADTLPDAVLGGEGSWVANLSAEPDATVTLYAIWKLPSSELADALDCGGKLIFRNEEPDGWRVVSDQEVRSSGWDVSSEFAAVGGTCLVNVQRGPNLSTFLSGRGKLVFNWMPYNENIMNTVYTKDASGSEQVIWTGHIEPSDYDKWMEVSLDLDFSDSSDATAVYFRTEGDDSIPETVRYCFLDNVRWIAEEGDEPTDADRPAIVSATRDASGLAIGIDKGDARFRYDLLTSPVLTDDPAGWDVLKSETGTGESILFHAEIRPEDPSRFYKVRVRAK